MRIERGLRHIRSCASNFTDVSQVTLYKVFGHSVYPILFTFNAFLCFLDVLHIRTKARSKLSCLRDWLIRLVGSLIKELL